MGQEIERKFLMSGFPKELVPFVESKVYQAYASMDPEIRIRKKELGTDESYFITFKSDGDLARSECEFPIEGWAYDEILKIIDRHPIFKDHKKYDIGNGLVLEVSYVENNFYYGEVEFKSVEEAENWAQPAMLSKYILRDITYNKDFKMKNYWKRTRLNSQKADN